MNVILRQASFDLEESLNVYIMTVLSVLNDSLCFHAKTIYFSCWLAFIFFYHVKAVRNHFKCIYYTSFQNHFI